VCLQGEIKALAHPKIFEEKKTGFPDFSWSKHTKTGRYAK
jgi:hypothetical protein